MSRISAHEVLRTRLCAVTRCPNQASYGDFCSVHRHDRRTAAQRLLDATAAAPETSLARRAPEMMRGPTARELEMLVRLAAGDTNDEAATATGVSVETVKSRVKMLLAKLGATNRAHAVAIGFRQGLIA